MSQHLRYEIVVVVYKSRAAITPFLSQLGPDAPVVLVDNSFHEDDLSDITAQYPCLRRIDSGGNLGYSAASNIGAKAANADYLIFMNPDTRPNLSQLERLIDYLDAKPTVACCGAAGIGTAGGGAQPTPRRMLVHSLGLHRRFPLTGIYYQDLQGKTVDVEWVAGSCLAIRRNTFNKLGGFDPRYFVYQSDFDLGLRIRQQGLRQVVLGDVVIPHSDGGSSDLPQMWTWQKRGRAWTRFLRNTHSLPGAIGMSGLLLVGYAARVALYTVSGRCNKARELGTYLRAAIAEWINPE